MLEARGQQVLTPPTPPINLLRPPATTPSWHLSSPLFFLFCYDSRRCSPLILNLSSELIAAPWPGEREIFSFGNMASRSSARLENLPLTRNVAAKISAPDDDKDSSYDPSKKRRSSVGDRMRAGMSDGNGRGDIQREVYSTPRFIFTLCF